MDILTLTLESIEQHNFEKFQSMTVKELLEMRKKIVGDVKARVELGKAQLKLNLPINAGLNKVLEENAPEFLENHPRNKVAEKVKRLNAKGEIEEKIVYTFVPVNDFTKNFAFKEMTEEEFAEIAQINAEDAELSAREIVKKYGLSAEVFNFKNAVHSVHISTLTLGLRRAKMLVAMRAMAIATIDVVIARKEHEAKQVFVETAGQWIKPAILKKMLESGKVPTKEEMEKA